jgi:hypothetical protein
MNVVQCRRPLMGCAFSGLIPGITESGCLYLISLSRATTAIGAARLFTGGRSQSCSSQKSFRAGW